VVMENNGEGHLDLMCEKWTITERQGGKEQPVYNTREGELG